MRLHRIELVTGSSVVELPFHHQTTVVAGLGRLEQQAFALEVLAAIGTGRPGLSADISTRTGRRLEIRRPLDDPAAVIDVDTNTIVTDEWATPSGTIDPSATIGIAGLTQVTESHLQAAEQTHDRVRRLARLDQDELWGLAISLAELEVEIARQTDDEVVADRISAEAAAEIEQARAEVDIANERLEELSDQAITGSACLVLVAFVVAFITHPLLAIPFLGAAVALGWRSWRWHQEHAEALAAERELLGAVGLESYLDFQLRKVDALTNDTAHRRKVLSLAERRRFALDRWRELVGPDVSLDWAATHRPTIATTARQQADTLAEHVGGDNDAAALALAERIREATASEETAPLLVDDIFTGQEDATVERLLWLIDHHGQQVQFIVLSSDARVLAWARQRATVRQATVMLLSDEPIETDAPATETVAEVPASDVIELVDDRTDSAAH